MSVEKIIEEYKSRFNINQKGFEKFFTKHTNKDFVENLPFIPDIEKFCIRLAEAKIKNQKICIYADYDTDAVTATACMYWGLIELGFNKGNLTFYAPDRFVEGYGVNPVAIKKLAKKNDLIITVDCGINSREEANVVKEMGKDIIITDHHILTGELPKALAVVNPRLNEHFREKKNIIDEVSSLEYQSFLTRYYKVQEEKVNKMDSVSSKTHLSSSVVGAGTSWFAVLWLGYFMQLEGLVGDDFNINCLVKTLPFAAIGTIADLQSILEPTNRILVKAGLQIMNQGHTGFKGLDKLTEKLEFFDKMESGYKLTSQDFAYYYSPILNSSGRISHAHLSIGLMLAGNTDQAEKESLELLKTNQDRKQMVKDILSEVESKAMEQVNSGESMIFLKGSWNKGIVGLLASRLVNMYNLPVIVSFKDEEGGTGGSARAPEGYHLPEAFEKVSQYFEKFGGHPGAAGFQMKKDNTKELHQELKKVFQSQKSSQVQSQEDFTPKGLFYPKALSQEISRKENIWVSDNDLTDELYEKIISLDPYGIDFSHPEFVFKIDRFQKRWLGKEQKHIKVSFKGKTVTIFNLSLDEQEFFNSDKSTFWVKAKLSQNTWNGRTTKELLANKIWID